MIVWWLLTAASAQSVFVFHQGAVEPGWVQWETRWVGVPPPLVQLGTPLPPETVSVLPTESADLIRLGDGSVVAIRRAGRPEVALRVPLTDGALVAPLWQGGAAQRVVATGAQVLPVGEVEAPSPEVVRTLDRVGSHVPSGAFVLHMVLDEAVVARGGRLGDVRPGGSIVWSLGWIGVAVLTSVVGVASMTRRPRRRRAARA